MTALSQELVAQHWRKNISPITGDSVDTLWELIWPLFREVPGFLALYDEAWTYKNVKMGHLQVWAYSDTEIRGIVLTKINVFPKCKVLDVMAMSGISGLQFIKEFDDVFELLAKQNGCAYISLSVRPGLERILTRKHRCEKQYSVVTRRVGELRSS